MYFRCLGLKQILKACLYSNHSEESCVPCAEPHPKSEQAWISLHNSLVWQNFFLNCKPRFTNNSLHYVDSCAILPSTNIFIVNFFDDWSMKIFFCETVFLRLCNLEGLRALWVAKIWFIMSPFIVGERALLCRTWGIFPTFLIFIHSSQKRCVIPEVLMKILCLILLCIFSLDYFLCRFLSKKVSKLIYTKFKYMFYTVNTCSHFSEFNITVASYFLSGLEKYDSMLSWF